MFSSSITNSETTRVEQYTNKDGRKYRVVVPYAAPASHARFGVVIGPPELVLDVPDAISVRIHNELFARNILTADDVNGRINEIRSAVVAAFGPLVEAIVEQYTAKK